jgi:hypothetical protein
MYILDYEELKIITGVQISPEQERLYTQEISVTCTKAWSICVTYLDKTFETLYTFNRASFTEEEVLSLIGKTRKEAIAFLRGLFSRKTHVL